MLLAISRVGRSAAFYAGSGVSESANASRRKEYAERN